MTQASSPPPHPQSRFPRKNQLKYAAFQEFAGVLFAQFLNSWR